MPTHVALLRGINVGGRNRLAMADLRALAEDLGLTEVATYIASGNLVFSTARADTSAIAGELEAAIADRHGITPAVVVLTRAELAEVVAGNPYPDVADGRHVHAVIHRDVIGAEAADAVAAAQRRAAEEGAHDEAEVAGRVVYLHTPDGMGRSRLAELLQRSGATADCTARNWRTIEKVRALLDG